MHSVIAQRGKSGAGRMCRIACKARRSARVTIYRNRPIPTWKRVSARNRMRACSTVLEAPSSPDPEVDVTPPPPLTVGPEE